VEDRRPMNIEAMKFPITRNTPSFTTENSADMMEEQFMRSL
jgi:hypothetical protein